MTDQELERRLAQAVDHAAPHDLEGVLSRCTERKGTVIAMKKVKSNGKRWLAVAACMALLLVGGGGGLIWQQANAVTSVVSLDVNPSIELSVNKNCKVVSCKALNGEAEAVLADMNGGKDLKNTTLDVAANALVGALVRHGYLDGVSSAILLSVEDDDAQRAKDVEEAVTQAVGMVLRTEAPTTDLMSQTLTPNADTEKLAQENNISAGKAVLVNQVLAKNPNLDFAKLSALTVEELRDLSEMKAPQMPIGREAALQAALKYAGVSGDYQIDTDVDPELDDVPACYEVELYHHNLGELEYKVDAWTGAILQGTKDVLKDQTANPNQISDQIAIHAALGTAGVKLSEASALTAKLDTEDGRAVWEIEFCAGNMEYECQVDAVTGKVLDMEKEQMDEPVSGGNTSNGTNGNANGTNGNTAAIDGNKAKTIALKHAGLTEAQVDYIRTDLDEEDGRSVIGVEFAANGYEYEYELDAATGSILSSEREADDD